MAQHNSYFSGRKNDMQKIGSYIGTGMGLGIVVGVVIGMLIEDIAVGIAIGVAMGAAFGAGAASRPDIEEAATTSQDEDEHRDVPPVDPTPH
jgi:MFS superfamily sulfate permease-like transporter